MKTLELKDLIHAVLSEIFGEELKHGYTISKDKDKPLYERLEMNLPLVRPSKKEIMDAFDRIKKRIERKENLKNRFKALMKKDSGIPSFHRVKKDISNAAKFIHDLLKDESRLTEAETLIIELEVEHDKLEQEEIAKRKRNDIPSYKEFLKAFVLAEVAGDTSEMDAIKSKVKDALGL